MSVTTSYCCSERRRGRGRDWRWGHAVEKEAEAHFIGIKAFRNKNTSREDRLGTSK